MNWNDPAERLALLERIGLEEFAHAQAEHDAHRIKNVAAITGDDIARASYTIDIDVAVRNLQDIAGITDGGLAGIMFADFEWLEASPPERLDALYAWINTERNHEPEQES
jgi:murein L,D-transpeptidase YcbB/YkuD